MGKRFRGITLQALKKLAVHASGSGVDKVRT